MGLVFRAWGFGGGWGIINMEVNVKKINGRMGNFSYFIELVIL